jgi:hypothetical protein
MKVDGAEEPLSVLENTARGRHRRHPLMGGAPRFR